MTLEGGNITFACPGNFSVKGGIHSFDRGFGTIQNLAALPESSSELAAATQPFTVPKFSSLIVLADTDGNLLKNRPYRIWRKDGSCLDGVTDTNGATQLLLADSDEILEFQILKRRV